MVRIEAIGRYYLLAPNNVMCTSDYMPIKACYKLLLCIYLTANYVYVYRRSVHISEYTNEGFRVVITQNIRYSNEHKIHVSRRSYKYVLFVKMKIL
jgi:hypothetical protein